MEWPKSEEKKMGGGVFSAFLRLLSGLHPQCNLSSSTPATRCISTRCIGTSTYGYPLHQVAQTNKNKRKLAYVSSRLAERTQLHTSLMSWRKKSQQAAQQNETLLKPSAIAANVRQHQQTDLTQTHSGMTSAYKHSSRGSRRTLGGLGTLRRLGS